ncbi:MAG: succinate dehydrogenase/fumarate reductase iron-sulfur subunit [Myxococcota bacterium]
MSLTLRVWRQSGPDAPGELKEYGLEGVSPNASFLEMMDLLNEQITLEGEELPIEFESDCREGICGTCGLVIDGQAHGPRRAVATCQLYMRDFKDGDTITIEPWRADGFPIIRDLVVDRSALDRIISAGGYVSVGTGPHADANAIKIPKDVSDHAFNMAACIGCGACVAACPNASASLFTSAKVSHLALMPQGRVERNRRVKRMVDQMDHEGFGNCSNIGECSAACPKGIPIESIARMKREYLRATLTEFEGA